jgi:WD40 repeat protein/mono/diheme cytochrome c family protein
MRILIALAVVVGFASVATAAESQAPVSFHRELRPLLNAQCNACHKPDKSKGDLDMTSYAALMKGGKKGAVVVAGQPAKSRLVEVCTGDEPEMPPEGDPLTKAQVAIIERWISQGAKDDTPALGSTKVEPPVYKVPPVISAMAWSPDGAVLAVSGYHEVVLHKGDGSGIIARLVGEMPRIEAIAFSKDGALIGVAGGSPGESGQIQIWDAKSHKLLKTFQPSNDSLYGLSFAPDGKSVAVGGADKVARRVRIEDGAVLTDFRAHADWVLATAFTLDGKQMVTGGRDKAMKLIDVESGRFIDDINNPLEQVTALARHPKEEKVLYGGDLGVARIYKISDNQGRTAGRNDTNLLVAFERLPAAVTACAFSPDGTRVALGTAGEVRVYDAGGKAPDPAAMAARPNPARPNPARPGRPARPVARSGGKALLELDGFTGPVFSVAYNPAGTILATGGFDGTVRLFDAATGDVMKEFPPVPLSVAPAQAGDAQSSAPQSSAAQSSAVPAAAGK